MGRPLGEMACKGNRSCPRVVSSRPGSHQHQFGEEQHGFQASHVPRGPYSPSVPAAFSLREFLAEPRGIGVLASVCSAQWPDHSRLLCRWTVGVSAAALFAHVDPTPAVHAAVGPVIAAAVLSPDPVRFPICPECVDWSRLVLRVHVLCQAPRALHVRQCFWLDATHCCRLAGALLAMTIAVMTCDVNVVVRSFVPLDFFRFSTMLMLRLNDAVRFFRFLLAINTISPSWIRSAPPVASKVLFIESFWTTLRKDKTSKKRFSTVGAFISATSAQQIFTIWRSFSSIRFSCLV